RGFPESICKLGKTIGIFFVPKSHIIEYRIIKNNWFLGDISQSGLIFMKINLRDRLSINTKLASINWEKSCENIDKGSFTTAAGPHQSNCLVSWNFQMNIL